MEEDKLAFLSGGTEDTAAAPMPEPDPPSPAAPSFALQASEDRSEGPGTARGADGRFVPHEAEPPPAPREAAAPGHVPLSAVLDEREKRRAAEARLAEYEARQREELARYSQAEMPPEARLEHALYAQNLRASRRFAEREYGRDTIAALHGWAVARCDADPIFNQQMLASEDPYEAAYQAYQREQVLAKVSPTDLAEFEAWKAQARNGAAASAASRFSAPANGGGFMPPQQPAPPRSLATAPNAGGSGLPEIQVGPGAAHASLFRR